MTVIGKNLFDFEKTADAVIVSPEIYDDSNEYFKKNNIDVIYSCENKSVDERLKYHADLQIARIGYKRYVCVPEAYDYYSNILKKYNVDLIKGNTYLSSNYPYDIAYNIIVTESYAVHNFKYTDSIIKRNLSEKNLINVSQGYSACLCIDIKNGVFITSDDGIYNAIVSAGLEVLKISVGNVILHGYNYGFFGGACGRIGNDMFVINGNISMHPDCDNIFSFCKKNKVKAVSLSDRPIFDIGSIIPICI